MNNTLVKSGEVRPRTLLNTVLGLTSHDLTNVIYRVVAGKENAGLGTLVYTFPAQHLLYQHSSINEMLLPNDLWLKTVPFREPSLKPQSFGGNISLEVWVGGTFLREPVPPTQTSNYMLSVRSD